jgi:hypothetical protein
MGDLSKNTVRKQINMGYFSSPLAERSVIVTKDTVIVTVAFQSCTGQFERLFGEQDNRAHGVRLIKSYDIVHWHLCLTSCSSHLSQLLTCNIHACGYDAYLERVHKSSVCDSDKTCMPLPESHRHASFLAT